MENCEWNQTDSMSADGYQMDSVVCDSKLLLARPCSSPSHTPFPFSALNPRIQQNLTMAAAFDWLTEWCSIICRQRPPRSAWDDFKPQVLQNLLTDVDNHHLLCAVVERELCTTPHQNWRSVRKMWSWTAWINNNNNNLPLDPLRFDFGVTQTPSPVQDPRMV